MRKRGYVHGEHGRVRSCDVYTVQVWLWVRMQVRDSFAGCECGVRGWRGRR